MSERRSRTYTVWANMIQRCDNPNNPNYFRYGGRGISVAPCWRYDFSRFLADMGEVPDGMSIERNDNDGDYTPDNCCWSPREVQANNTRRNVFVTLDGMTKTVSQWCEELGLNTSTVFKRINRSGWTPEQALTVPKLWNR